MIFTDKVEKAVASSILTQDEAKMLSQYEVLRNEIIKVNEFTFDLSQVIA